MRQAPLEWALHFFFFPSPAGTLVSQVSLVSPVCHEDAPSRLQVSVILQRSMWEMDRTVTCSVAAGNSRSASVHLISDARTHARFSVHISCWNSSPLTDFVWFILKKSSIWSDSDFEIPFFYWKTLLLSEVILLVKNIRKPLWILILCIVCSYCAEGFFFVIIINYSIYLNKQRHI